MAIDKLRAIASYYNQEIKELSKELTPRGFRALQHVFTSLLSSVDPTVLKWRTHMTAEDMGVGPLSANEFESTLLQTKELFQKIFPEKTECLQELSTALEIVRHPTPANIQSRISALDLHQRLWVPLVTNEHAMIAVITSTKRDTQGNKIYKVALHNTGGGIDLHYQLVGSDRKRRYQSSYEIENVQEQALLEVVAEHTSSLEKSESIEQIYTQLLPKLQGKKLPKSKDSRLWRHGQIGGSCAASSILSVLKAELSKEEYKQFRIHSRFELLLNSYREILSGQGDTPLQKLVTLEMIDRLKRSCRKQHVPLALELRLLQHHLETAQVVPELPRTSSFLDHAKAALTLLKSYQRDGAILDAAESHIAPLLTIRTSEEEEEIVTFVERLDHFYTTTPLRERQRYLLTALVAAIARRYPQATKLRDFATHLTSESESLQLCQKANGGDYAVASFNKLIEQ